MWLIHTHLSETSLKSKASLPYRLDNCPREPCTDGEVTRPPAKPPTHTRTVHEADAQDEHTSANLSAVQQHPPPPWEIQVHAAHVPVLPRDGCRSPQHHYLTRVPPQLLHRVVIARMKAASDSSDVSIHVWRLAFHGGGVDLLSGTPVHSWKSIGQNRWDTKDGSIRCKRTLRDLTM